jgi:TrmH family RNA methyltransferase
MGGAVKNSDETRPGLIKEITSTANPIIKQIKGLSLKKNRDEDGLFMTEGLKLVSDALQAGWEIVTLLYSKQSSGNMSGGKGGLNEIAAQCRAKGADILEVNDKVLAAISRRDNPQTVIAVFRQHWSSLSKIEALGKSSGDVLLALDRVRDPGNLGTIIRTADSAGAKGLILIGDTTDPFSLEASRASMGSIFHLPIAKVSEDAFANWRSGFKGRVAGTHLEGAVDYRGVAWNTAPCLLIMGNEQQGLTPNLAALCDDLVIIPMSGKADSLNLAIATGVMLFEIRRNFLTLENTAKGQKNLTFAPPKTSKAT